MPCPRNYFQMGTTQRYLIPQVNPGGAESILVFRPQTTGGGCQTDGCIRIL
ncbi:MAG: hypothetical protein G3M70_09720 [Candidatus Nitronauta litoralis]|uniref:Uncharacterized protein n=1 Tax=Candidatus Nitronauta litoralis TaxID=2705533 RepID=A0A7T0G0B9_9BACT|nr:MAG: hypothetical protein G3M70_09720 [Candidatus Nitronauta litoralis]